MLQEIEVSAWVSLPTSANQVDQFWVDLREIVETLRDDHGIDDLRSIDMKPEQTVSELSSEIPKVLSYKVTIGGYSNN